MNPELVKCTKNILSKYKKCEMSEFPSSCMRDESALRGEYQFSNVPSNRKISEDVKSEITQPSAICSQDYTENTISNEKQTPVLYKDDQNKQEILYLLPFSPQPDKNFNYDNLRNMSSPSNSLKHKIKLDIDKIYISRNLYSQHISNNSILHKNYQQEIKKNNPINICYDFKIDDFFKNKSNLIDVQLQIGYKIINTDKTWFIYYPGKIFFDGPFSAIAVYIYIRFYRKLDSNKKKLFVVDSITGCFLAPELSLEPLIKEIKDKLLKNETVIKQMLSKTTFADLNVDVVQSKRVPFRKIQKRFNKFDYVKFNRI